jgi:hypothetical protein
MKKRTVLIIALLLAAGLGAAWMIYSGSSGSAFCEHPVNPDPAIKQRPAKPDGLEAATNVVCEPDQVSPNGQQGALKSRNHESGRTVSADRSAEMNST